MCNLFVSVLILNKYMIIERNEYLDQLLAKKWNGKVKIITGIRRSGKSFLLSTLFKNKMIKEGVAADDFINIDLDRKSNMENPGGGDHVTRVRLTPWPFLGLTIDN